MARRSPPRTSDAQLDLFDFASAARTGPTTGTTAPPEPAATAGLSRHFLGWDRALPEAVVDYLAEPWDGRGALDLEGVLVVVPTRHAGRRLREALAVRAAAREAAVLPPRTVTPDFLVAPERLPDAMPAGRIETLMIWAAELLEIDFDDFRHLFPVDPVERNFTWAMKVASDLLSVRGTLNEAGLGMGEVARIVGQTELEPERWAELATLERRCIRTTGRLGWQDPVELRRSAADGGRPPEDVRRIVVAGVLDPPPLAVKVLERWSTEWPVEVLVHAPEASHGHAFDAVGRPLEEAWLREPIAIGSPAETIHPSGTPGDQAEQAVARLAGHDDPSSVAALGVADAELVAPLEKSLAGAVLGSFDPAGQPVRRHGLYHLLQLIGRLAASRSFRAAAELLRCPDVGRAALAHLQAQGTETSLRRVLDDLDHVAATTLPDTLADALQLAPRALRGRRSDSPVPEVLAWLEGMLARLEAEAGPGSASGDFVTALTEVLAEIHAGRTFRSDDPRDAVVAAIADHLGETLDALDGPAAEDFPGGLGLAERLELLLLAIGEQRYHPERRQQDIDLLGWLELSWEDAPHLVLAGMNDGRVPESILGHPFLPDSLRRLLGLRHNDSRHARDACLLTSLVESRRHGGGRIDFFFGRTGADGTPLRPSRLLLQVPEQELPARTLQFFRGTRRHSDPVPWQLAWKLRPPPLPADAPIRSRLSVTQIRDYLTCPFRFYLRHGLRMEEIDATRSEMNAMEFGSLLHGVLEAFAGDAEAAQADDPAVIAAYFHATLDRHLHGIYGPRLTVPVTIQRESARQRLAWWAEFEAQQRAAGWRIVAAETRLSPDDDPWTIGGLPIRGVVDRVERHDREGVRLIDFKTYSPYNSHKRERKSVEEYHLARIKRTEDPADFPEWRLTRTSAGDIARWTDLQLPLYRLAMARRFPGERITTAHVTLGKTKADIGLDPWPELDGALLESAEACAVGVVAAVREGIFWPPTERLPYGDDFGHLFFGEPLEAIDPASLAAAASEEEVAR